jgi:hypothetical protein
MDAGFGLLKVSFCCHADLSSSKSELPEFLT